MLYPFPPDLQTLVGEQMASGKYASEDELLRRALLALAEEEQDLDPKLFQRAAFEIGIDRQHRDPPLVRRFLDDGSPADRCNGRIGRAPNSPK